VTNEAQPEYARGRRAGRGRGVLVRRAPKPRSLDLPSGGARPLPPPIPEAALYPIIADHFAERGLACWREASFLGSWIDLYARDERGHTVSVEAKVKDWKRALRQAQLVRNSAERVYVAVWAPYVHRALTDAARADFGRTGVGLLSVNGHCEVLIEARDHHPRYPEAVLTSPTSQIR
jgi:hypothetical protein